MSEFNTPVPTEATDPLAPWYALSTAEIIQQLHDGLPEWRVEFSDPDAFTPGFLGDSLSAIDWQERRLTIAAGAEPETQHFALAHEVSAILGVQAGRE